MVPCKSCRAKILRFLHITKENEKNLLSRGDNYLFLTTKQGTTYKYNVRTHAQNKKSRPRNGPGQVLFVLAVSDLEEEITVVNHIRLHVQFLNETAGSLHSSLLELLLLLLSIELCTFALCFLQHLEQEGTVVTLDGSG